MTSDLAIGQGQDTEHGLMTDLFREREMWPVPREREQGRVEWWDGQGNECISALKAKEEKERQSSEREVLDKGGGGSSAFPSNKLKREAKKTKICPSSGHPTGENAQHPVFKLSFFKVLHYSCFISYPSLMFLSTAAFIFTSPSPPSLSLDMQKEDYCSLSPSIAWGPAAWLVMVMALNDVVMGFKAKQGIERIFPQYIQVRGQGNDFWEAQGLLSSFLVELLEFGGNGG
ncbi:uncharacterized [Tachysurus ichikawai]